ncbi:MAG: DUF2577 domain-containing protein [Clostridium sp.]|nr:DUF2577 domain-containing protein [Clostridium sp.]
MPADYTELLQALKRAAVEAVEAGKPVTFCYGTVTSVKPLQIQVDPKLLLEEMQLELTNAVQDIWLDVEVSTHTENDAFMNGRHTHRISDTYTGGGSCDQGNLDTTHKHAIKGRKKLRIFNGLQVGERVLLLRWQGGQRFLVLDRVSPAITKGDCV